MIYLAHWREWLTYCISNNSMMHAHKFNNNYKLYVNAEFLHQGIGVMFK